MGIENYISSVENCGIDYTETTNYNHWGQPVDTTKVDYSSGTGVTKSYIYTYEIPKEYAVGRSTLVASYSDGLFETTASAVIAKDMEDQKFKILRSGAARAMAFDEDVDTKGMKIFKDGRTYGKAFSKETITYS